MKPVPKTPALPFPRTATSIPQLSQFDQDLVKSLWVILAEIAQRLNATLPKDGSEAMTGQLNIQNDTDISSITQTTAPLNIGTYAGNNTMIDGNELQARTNGVASLWSAQLFGGNITFGDTSTIFTLNGGKLKFPASQQASSDANTLDDYEEGTWTPVITFTTNGDLSVTYSAQAGGYVKIGKTVTIWMLISTSAFTHTTASGEMRITGLPFTAAGSSRISGSLELQGFNWPGGATQVTAGIPAATSYVRVIATGSGLSRVAITAADHPSGTNGVFVTTISYEV